MTELAQFISIQLLNSLFDFSDGHDDLRVTPGYPLPFSVRCPIYLPALAFIAYHGCLTKRLLVDVASMGDGRYCNNSRRNID